MDGLGLVSYTEYAGYLKVSHCDDVACSSVSAPSTIDYADGNSSVTIGSDGLPLISYYATSGLTVTHCNDLLCSDFDTYLLDDDEPGTGQYNSITIGVDGLGLISYFEEVDDDLKNDLKVAHCNNVACSSATLSPMGIFAESGMYTSITIGSDGLGLISHFRPDDGTLQVSHCYNIACTSADTYALDFDLYDNRGKYSSITIGDDGLGLITYYYEFGSSKGELRVANCIDLACSRAVITTIDSFPTNLRVGRYSSVTIGADGLPLISYYEDSHYVTDGKLKVIHCGSDFCTPFFRRR
jgi:hypothetical protein